MSIPQPDNPKAARSPRHVFDKAAAKAVPVAAVAPLMPLVSESGTAWIPTEAEAEIALLRHDYARVRQALIRVVTGEDAEPSPETLAGLESTVRQLASRSDGDESRMALGAIAALRETRRVDATQGVFNPGEIRLMQEASRLRGELMKAKADYELIRRAFLLCATGVDYDDPELLSYMEKMSGVLCTAENSAVFGKAVAALRITPKVGKEGA